MIRTTTRLAAALAAALALGWTPVPAIAANTAGTPAAGRITISAGPHETPAEYQQRASAICPTNRACVWTGYWDAADQGALWYYSYTRLKLGVNWSGTAADANTSSWYNRLDHVGTTGAPYMLMSSASYCNTTSGWYVRLAAGQVANGRNPATNWDNTFRSAFSQPPPSGGCA